MVSRPMTHAEILDQINNILGTTLSTTWTDAKLSLLLSDAITEVSEAVPYVMRDIYTIESRTGMATATTTDYLEDSSAAFVAADVGKVVYNSTDKTWATIVSRSSATKVGVSKDIFATGEHYEIYNKKCWSEKQINIEKSSDYLWIIGALYPVQPGLWLRNLRNVIEHSRDIIELDVAGVDDSSKAKADKDVHVYFAREHKVDVMVKLTTGATTAAGTAGDTSIAVDGLDTTGTCYKNSLFYFTKIDAVTTDSRLIYRITEDVTFSGGAGTIKFFPGLECGVSENDTITFIRSTLTPDLERIIIQIVAGEAIMAEAVTQINAIPKGGTGVSTKLYETGERMAEKARLKLKSLVDVDLRANKVLSRN